MLECKVVAITRTEVERNLVTISTKEIADPHFRIAVFMEILKTASRPWDDDRLDVLLILNGVVYSLIENSDADVQGRQDYHFEMVEDIAPQLEDLIEKSISKVL